MYKAPNDLGSCFQLAQDLAAETDTKPSYIQMESDLVSYKISNTHSVSAIIKVAVTSAGKGCFLFLCFLLVIMGIFKHTLSREFPYPDSTPSTYSFHLSHYPTLTPRHNFFFP